MRINVYLASSTGISRRKADQLINDGKVQINGRIAQLGDQVEAKDDVKLENKQIANVKTVQTILLNKPVGYVCSRDGQGSKTIYDLLPLKFHHLKPIGRLDKDSSGLILLTNNGRLAHQLTHPSFNKEKVYEVTLDDQLTPEVQQKLLAGVELEDGPSQLKLAGGGKDIAVMMTEGRNRQIRRSFEAVGYKVVGLNRIQFGEYKLDDLDPGQFKQL